MIPLPFPGIMAENSRKLLAEAWKKACCQSLPSSVEERRSESFPGNEKIKRFHGIEPRQHIFLPFVQDTHAVHPYIHSTSTLKTKTNQNIWSVRNGRSTEGWPKKRKMSPSGGNFMTGRILSI